MMQVFRSLVGKVAAGVFAVLMFVFILTSVDWSQVTGGSRTTVGEIEGVRIPLATYQQLVQNALENHQRQTGRSATAEDVEQARNAVWNDLVQRQALEREYQRRGITVTADEIAQAMQYSPPPEVLSAPDFQTDSQFDIGKYHRWLRSSAAAQVIPLLEAQYADEIRRGKLLRVVTADVYVSDPALWQAWRDQHERVTIELATIDAQAAVPDSAVTLSDQEVRAYYNGHREEFRRSATAYLSFVHIPRAADASDSAAARAHAEALRQEILDGAPFEEVARRESADSVSGERGGDLGEFSRGTMDPAFEQAAYSLPVGRVSEPVLSAFGYHLIKVESRSGGKVRARHILVPVEITGAHRDQLDARADSLELLGAERLDPTALDSAARRLGLSIGQTNPVQEGTRVLIGVQVVPDAGVWAFQARPGETSRIIELSYAFFLFRLDSLIPAGIPAFEEIQGSVRLAAAQARKRELAKTVAADVNRRLQEGSSLAQAARALGLTHQQLGPFSRLNPAVPDPGLVGAAFGLAEGRTAGPVDTENGIYFLRVVKREPADSAAFAKGMDDFRVQQIRLAQQARVRSYLDALRTRADVEDYRSQIFRTEAQAAAEAGGQS